MTLPAMASNGECRLAAQKMAAETTKALEDAIADRKAKAFETYRYCLIHQPGSLIKFGPAQDRIEATIIQACIRHLHCVQYEVSYWSSGTRQTCWIEEHEVYCDHDNRIPIGFHNEVNQ
jgi:hypothetical protein